MRWRRPVDAILCRCQSTVCLVCVARKSRLSTSDRGRVPYFFLGCAYTRLREHRKAIASLTGQHAKAERILEGLRRVALKALEGAHAAREPRMINLNDPFFSELASEPRYQQLLAKLRLPSGSC
jgi:hypothetical protein